MDKPEITTTITWERTDSEAICTATASAVGFPDSITVCHISTPDRFMPMRDEDRADEERFAKESAINRMRRWMGIKR